MNNNIEFQCQVCHLILKQPISLSCKCESSNICREHLNRLGPNETGKVNFECIQCKTKMEISINEIKINEELRNEIEEKLFSNFYSKLNEIKSKCDQIIVKCDEEFLLKIGDHFESLRNLMDIKRETYLEANLGLEQEKIERMHCLSDRFIKNVESTEKEFRQNFIKELRPLQNETKLKIEKQFDVEKKSLEDSLRKPRNEREIECFQNSKSIKYDLILKGLKRKFIKFGSMLEFRLEFNRFEELKDKRLTQNKFAVIKFYSNEFNSNTDKYLRVIEKDFSNGDSFVGDCLDDKNRCKGKMVYATGDVYEGDWVISIFAEKNIGSQFFVLEKGYVMKRFHIRLTRNGNGKMIYTNRDIQW